MEHVVLVIHLMLAVSIIVLVLLQRSEGGGLGIGQSGGLGGLSSPGGTASALTKVTGFFAMCFFATSLILGVLAGTHSSSKSILDKIDTDNAPISAPIDLESTADDLIQDNVEIEEDSNPKTPSVPVE